MIEAHIDLSALRRNTLTARQLAPQSRLLAVIKANAYGHGLLPVASCLSDLVDGFAVARWNEALALRRHGITRRIVVMSSLPTSREELCLAAEQQLDIVVHETSTLPLLIQGDWNGKLNVWLKIDTGMHRLGLAPDQAASCYHALTANPRIASIVVMSHFASADVPGDPFNHQQQAQLAQISAQLNAPASMANSAALISQPDARLDWNRPGIMLYGAHPMGESAQPPLEPVMTLRSRLLAVRDIDAGDSVGYNRAWSSRRRTRIGTIAAGYGDGYPRHAACGTPVLVNGRRTTLVGRVSMDMITVDLGPQAIDQPNDPVVLWGKGLPVNEIAAHANTIAYQLLTGVTPRVDFAYSG